MPARTRNRYAINAYTTRETADQVKDLASEEDRTVSSMAHQLLKEALAAREAAQKRSAA